MPHASIKKLVRDQHSSLFDQGDNYKGKKSFIAFGSEIKFKWKIKIKIF
jgi:hypothetical protein